VDCSTANKQLKITIGILKFSPKMCVSALQGIEHRHLGAYNIFQQGHFALK
jgi:hypothetical protein